MKSRFNNFTFIYTLMLAFITSSCNSISDKGLRQTTNINKGWEYLEYNAETPDAALANENWKDIDLPHTWNAIDATDLAPGYRRDGSWYRKDIEISNISAGQVFQLYFEGVNITSKVYVNGKNVGQHIGGYIGFNLDITGAVKEGKNQILVYANNGYNPEVIPSQKSDFFIYGGITRDVWLKTLPAEHVNDLKITTPEIDLMIDIADKNGSLASKIVGSGGGGSIVCLSNNKETSTKILNKFNEIGVKEAFIAKRGSGPKIIINE